MEDLLLFVVVGFAAQLIDGAIGMAYGVGATSVLLSMGVTPAVASSTVHAAEVFTSGASGFSHWRLGNVRKDLLWRLAIPGMVGGGLGAYVLVSLPGDRIQPFVAAYLIAMGVVIVVKALRPKSKSEVDLKFVRPLGFGGALLDAIGGGGWGPMVTSTLISRGIEPRFAVGTSNAAEFFITTVISVTFFSTVGLELWPKIVGLIIGGAVAAPFGARLARQLPDKTLMILVGVVVILLSVRNLVHYLT